MSELSIQKQQRGLSPKEYRRLAELGYKTQDIKDLGITKVRELIQSGTVKTGATDLQIQREEKLKLQNKKKLDNLLKRSKTLDTKWEKNLKVFNAQNDTNYTLDDFKKAKLINEGGYGRGSTFQIKGKNYNFDASGALYFGGYLDHNAKVLRFQNNQPLPETKPETKKSFQPTDWTFGKSLKKQIKDNQLLNKVDTTIKQQDVQLQNRSNLNIPLSPGNKDHMPITNNNKELSIVK